MLQLNSKNIPYQSVQVFLSLVSKFSVIAKKVELSFDKASVTALVQIFIYTRVSAKFENY